MNASRAKNDPRVSVLMSVYNGEKYLREAIDSVLDQTFGDFEFLIIDDASTDSTSGILKEYAQKDNRIVLNRNDRNLGLTRSLIKMLPMARGGYIARMDADDICHPLRFEKQVRFLDDNPAVALVGTRFDIIDEKSVKVEAIDHSSGFPIDSKNIYDTLLHYNCIGHSTIMFRAKSALSAGGYRSASYTRYAQDYDFLLRLSEVFPLANLPETLMSYRLHRDQIRFVKLREQVNSIRLMREMAVRRRLKKGVPVEEGLTRPLSLRQRLTASPGSLGDIYFMLSREYAVLGWDDAARRAIVLAFFHSPLCPGIRKAFMRAMFEKTFKG